MSEFKVGDRVVITGKFKDTSSVRWSDLMDKTVGKEGVITVDTLNSAGTFGVKFGEYGGWYYTPDVLKLVPKGRVVSQADLLVAIANDLPVKPEITQIETNPKAAIGSKALAMGLLSPLIKAMGSLGKLNGKLKYGGSNYIGTEVVMSIYLDAIERHLDKLRLGEWADEVDNVPHLGAIVANCDIIASASAAGTLIDDRLRCDGQLEGLKALTPIVASLQELHKEKNPKHYYMKDK